MPRFMSVSEYAALINRNPRTVYYYIKAGKLPLIKVVSLRNRKRVLVINAPDEAQPNSLPSSQPVGDLWPISLYAGFIGLSTRRFQQLIKAGQVTGVMVLNSRIRLIDFSNAKIESSFNCKRRTTGHPIGRSKPLRGEQGFIDKYRS